MMEKIKITRMQSLTAYNGSCIAKTTEIYSDEIKMENEYKHTFSQKLSEKAFTSHLYIMFNKKVI